MAFELGCRAEGAFARKKNVLGELLGQGTKENDGYGPWKGVNLLFVKVLGRGGKSRMRGESGKTGLTSPAIQSVGAYSGRKGGPRLVGTPSRKTTKKQRAW